MKINEPSRNQNRQEVTDPHVVINEFFEWYSLEHSKRELAQLAATSILASEAEGQGQPEALFFHEKLSGLLDAAWLFCQMVPGPAEPPVS